MVELSGWWEDSLTAVKATIPRRSFASHNVDDHVKKNDSKTYSKALFRNGSGEHLFQLVIKKTTSKVLCKLKLCTQ